MIIYRLEDYDRKGFFNSVIGYSIEMQPWYTLVKQKLYHPLPERDPILVKTFNFYGRKWPLRYRFGCISLEDLVYWFGDKLLIESFEGKFLVNSYKIPKKYTRIGHRQLVYPVNKAILYQSFGPSILLEYIK